VAYEVEWAETALLGLLEAVEYIARDSPSYAATLAVRADRAAASLFDLPNRGRRVGEYRDPAVRELIVDSYRLIYRVSLSSRSFTRLAILDASSKNPIRDAQDAHSSAAVAAQIPCAHVPGFARCARTPGYAPEPLRGSLPGARFRYRMGPQRVCGCDAEHVVEVER